MAQLPLLLPLLLLIAAWAPGGSAVKSLAHQNYEYACRTGLDQRINDHLQASYLFKVMAAHFSHDSRALHGFAKFFSKASQELREHADEMVEYQIKRGGEATFHQIQAPEITTWDNGLAAMQDAMEHVKSVYDNLLYLHEACRRDPATQDFLESKFMKEHLQRMKKLADHVTVLKRLRTSNPQLGEYLFDEELD